MRIASKCVAGWLAVTGLMCATVICGQEVGAPATPPKPKTVEITPTNIQAHVGDKIKFTAVAKDDAGKTIDVKPMLCRRTSLEQMTMAMWFSARRGK
jgi:hypothetical protein